MASTDLLSVQLLIDGTAATGIIKSITIQTSINTIDEAAIILNDGSKSNESFQLSDSGTYDPGKQIEVLAGYHSQEESIFKGIIVNQSIQVDPQEGPSMTLICKHEMVKSTLSCNNAYYQELKDSNIINNIVTKYDITSSVDATSYTHETIVQYNTKDWDFLLNRAALNGLVVYTEKDKLYVVKPFVSGGSVHQITYGNNLIDMNISIHSDNQFSGIRANSWNADKQKITSQKASEPQVNEQGRLTGKQLAKVLQQNKQLQTTTFQEDSQLKSWSDAQLLFNRLARFSGYITCTGNSEVKLNSLVELQGVSKNLNGELFVNTIIHHLEEGQWETELGVGFQEEWFSYSAPSSSTSRSFTGLQIATVKQINQDPKERFRVKISFPLLEDDSDGIWARLNSFYASNEVGAFFYPEIGDEVIVGFLEDDFSAPIILGSMYSKKHKSYQEPDEKNTHKTILTKSKLKLDFDDENKMITLETPAKNTIIINDKEKSIGCTDQHTNSWKMNKEGITITSNKNITMKAKGDITLQAQNISLEADNGISQKSLSNTITAENELTLKGLNVSLKADVSLSAQAQANTEIKASGNTSIKGAMVLIN